MLSDECSRLAVGFGAVAHGVDDEGVVRLFGEADAIEIGDRRNISRFPGIDGLGQRVIKVAGGVTTVYVYDAFGNLDAEYSSQTPTSPCGTATCYLVTDHLGSTRMLTDIGGSGGTGGAAPGSAGRLVKDGPRLAGCSTGSGPAGAWAAVATAVGRAWLLPGSLRAMWRVRRW